MCGVDAGATFSKIVQLSGNYDAEFPIIIILLYVNNNYSLQSCVCPAAEEAKTQWAYLSAYNNISPSCLLT